MVIGYNISYTYSPYFLKKSSNWQLPPICLLVESQIYLINSALLKESLLENQTMISGNPIRTSSYINYENAYF